MSGNPPRGFHGLPARPQFQAQPQAGPSRPANRNNNAGGGHQRRTTDPPQQMQQPAYPYGYPYATPAYNPSGGYQTYPYTWNQQYPPQPAQTFDHKQAAGTPDGYSYSGAYRPQLAYTPADGHRRMATGPAQVAPLVSVPAAPSVKPWRNCSQPGCMFVGSGEDVEIHEGDRHLIFPHGKPVERSEEEEKWARHKGPAPPIEGTGIVLQTDEDIAKWIAERKAKWPSSKRVAEKDEEREAAIARGENPDRGRGRGGRGGGRRADPASQAEDWGRPAHDNAAAGPSRGHGQVRGRGQARGRGAAPARGGAAPYVSTPIIAQLAPDETLADPSDKDMQSPKPAVAASAVAGKDKDKALDDDAVSSSGDSSSGSGSDSDAEDETVKPDTTRIPPKTETSKPVCRFFAKNGRCKMGNKCRFSHTIDGKAPAPAPPIESRPKGPKQPPLKRVNPFERPSMLGALLATPINNTLSQLNQTIRFLVANDMLDGVELKPGDAEQQAKDQSKVMVIEEGDVATAHGTESGP